MKTTSNARSSASIGLALILMSVSSCATAIERDSAESGMKTRVVYAGLAMVGSDADLASNYPYSIGLEDRLNAHLIEKVRSIQPEHYLLLTDQLAQTRLGYSLAMGFVVDHEKISVEKVAGVYKVITDISAQLVLFDFDREERAIIALHPMLTHPYIEIFQKPPTNAELERLVEQYYFGGLHEMTPLVDSFLDSVYTLDPKHKYASEIGLGTVYVHPRAGSVLPPNLASAESFKQLVARQLASRLASHQRVSVVPYVLDRSVAGMALRFTGEESATYFELPEPDYIVDFAVRGFESKLHESTEAVDLYLYGAYAQVRVRPLGGLGESVVFDQQLQNGAFKRVPLGSDDLDHWAATEQTLFGLLDTFTQEVAKPSSTYIKEQKLTRADLKQYKNFAEILEQCR